MSYDVYLRIDTGGPDAVSVWDRNHTSNCAGMWDAAGARIRDWRMKPATEVQPLLAVAISNMRKDPETYRAMEPKNEWGSYASCLEFLQEFEAACRANPKCFVWVSN